MWRQPRTPRKGQPPPLHPCAPGCLYISWLPSFDLLTYTHRYIHTYVHTYVHICQDDIAKVSQGWMALPGSLGVHNPPSGIPTHTKAIYLHTYVRTYTHIHIHTYVQTYVHTYWREAPGGRRKVPGTYITWILVGYIHMYIFRSHLGTISVEGWVALEPVGRGTLQRR